MTVQAVVPGAGSLRLHYNENTGGCSPAVLDALRAITREEIAAYPDYTAVSARAARWFGVAPEGLILTNGLDEGLYALSTYAAWHAASPAGAARARFVIVEPAFEMYGTFTGMVRAEAVRIAPDPDFAFPLAAVVDALTPAVRAVFLTDPNNPTGLALPPGAAEAIAAAAPGAVVLVDEAYADFSGRSLIGPALDRYRNLVVGRTFAKGHGLAGFRVGALVGHPETIERLRRLLPPFNVNVCAIRALEAALDDRGYLAWYVAQVAASKAIVYDFCRRQGLHYWPSEANFVLVRLGERAPAVASALAARGIFVRDTSAAPGCRGCLRLTAGVVEHTTRALTAMEDVLASRPN